MSRVKLPQERFVFIEMLAFWMGAVRNKDLEHQFGITRQQAYKDFALHQELHPGYFIKKDKACYECIDHQQPPHFSGGLEDFLIWLETGSFTLSQPLADTCASRLQLPERRISRQVVAKLVQAIHQKARVEVD